MLLLRSDDASDDSGRRKARGEDTDNEARERIKLQAPGAARGHGGDESACRVLRVHRPLRKRKATQKRARRGDIADLCDPRSRAPGPRQAAPRAQLVDFRGAGAASPRTPRRAVRRASAGSSHGRCTTTRGPHRRAGVRLRRAGRQIVSPDSLPGRPVPHAMETVQFSSLLDFRPSSIADDTMRSLLILSASLAGCLASVIPNERLDVALVKRQNFTASSTSASSSPSSSSSVSASASSSTASSSGSSDGPVVNLGDAGTWRGVLQNNGTVKRCDAYAERALTRQLERHPLRRAAYWQPALQGPAGPGEAVERRVRRRFPLRADRVQPGRERRCPALRSISLRKLRGKRGGCKIGSWCRGRRSRRPRHC